MTEEGNFVGMAFLDTNYTRAHLHMAHDYKCVDVGALDEGTSVSVHDMRGRHLGGQREVANFLAIYKL